MQSCAERRSTTIGVIQMSPMESRSHCGAGRRKRSSMRCTVSAQSKAKRGAPPEGRAATDAGLRHGCATRFGNSVVHCRSVRDSGCGEGLPVTENDASAPGYRDQPRHAPTPLTVAASFCGGARSSSSSAASPAVVLYRGVFDTRARRSRCSRRSWVRLIGLLLIVAGGRVRSSAARREDRGGSSGARATARRVRRGRRQARGQARSSRRGR